MKSIWERTQYIANKIAEKKDNSIKKVKELEINNPISNGNDNNLDHNNNVYKEIYLPISKKTQIPVPNTILRSALFGVVAKGARRFEKSILKATINGYSVKYTGEQLDQSDLDVWLECLQRCQDNPLGNTVIFSSYDFLKNIKRNTGKSDHEWLKSVFLRLRVSDIEISDGKYTYAGSLISEHYRDEKTGKNCVVLNPKLADCFGDAGWTGITKALRLKLKGKPLTQWLFGFYCSHAKPLPIKVETLKRLCGSEISELRVFRFKLRKNLFELSDITGWHCEIDEKDKVIVHKNNH
ncbi:plasmid replication initiator TrfA [Arsenophonus sp. PmNCSU2021_1]|uniref:plasmid replication initiator TrfA n=1 Tax=Arsenophonus sp. PmNCSU2021_1 TaxID=3118989 RepID=UPI002FF045E4